MVIKLLVFSSVIVEITISRHSFVFSQSHVKVPICLSNKHVEGQAIGAFDLLKHSLSVIKFVPILGVVVSKLQQTRLLLRLSKHQSPTTDLLRTTQTWTITLYGLIFFIGSHDVTSATLNYLRLQRILFSHSHLHLVTYPKWFDR